MGEAYESHFKRVVEETCETFGYVILFIGAVEVVVHVRHLTLQVPPKFMVAQRYDARGVAPRQRKPLRRPVAATAAP